ncbi:MAG: hypothetical protein AMJ95_01235 [Omnitrophica WOR_2 bacterium SM23_72]|nr:MAG: hypothetical protein AMJ95_01235 [Omnitrophica WOR_2 bacterium SM23_72]
MTKRYYILAAITYLALIFILYSASVQAEDNNRSIRIAYPSIGTIINGQIGQIFERTDILSRNGLRGEVIAFPYGPPMMEALLSGKVDIALTSEQNVVVLLSKGFPARIIASLGSGGRLGLIVPVNSSVKSVGDLKGKKVGTIFGSSIHRPAVVWLKEAGLVPNRDASLVNVAGAELKFALLNGSLDAIMSWDPYIEEFLQNNSGRLIKGKEFKLAVIMSEDFIMKNPEAAVDFIIALKESFLYLISYKEQVNGWYSKLCRIEAELIDRSSAFNTFYSQAKSLSDINLAMDQDFVKTLEDISYFLFEQGLTNREVDVRSAVDLSLLKKAEDKLKTIKYDPSSVMITSP